MPAHRSPKHRQRRSGPYQCSSNGTRRSGSSWSGRVTMNRSGLEALAIVRNEKGFNDMNRGIDDMMDVDVDLPAPHHEGVEYLRPGHHAAPQQGEDRVDDGGNNEEHHRGWWMLLFIFFFVIAVRLAHEYGAEN
ncbi:hypothetical protein EYR38_009903 [Pleurotus pulmonarius]|nr:hypothetical protein EYR38_009903 [Pleurotus pulmonarius]